VSFDTISYAEHDAQLSKLHYEIGGLKADLARMTAARDKAAAELAELKAQYDALYELAAAVVNGLDGEPEALSALSMHIAEAELAAVT
jgi:chromosome segregation ATPase